MSNSPVTGSANGSIRSLRAAAAPLTKTVLMRLGGYAAIRRVRPSRGLAILRYHAICAPGNCDYADPAICIGPAEFERHVAYLTNAYSVIRLDEAVRALAHGKPLPRNAVAITFDDGYADNLAAAATLARYGTSATFYITAGCVAGSQPFWPAELRYLIAALPPSRLSLNAGQVRVEIDGSTEAGRATAVRQLTRTFKGHPIPIREALRAQLRQLANHVEIPPVMLSWDDIRQMHRLGMTIGSHTMTHPNLPNAGAAAARVELVASKRRLEDEINAPVTMFSYPNGGADRYMTAEIARLVKESGYEAATTSRNAFAASTSDLFALERVQVSQRLEDLVFALEVERFALQPAPRPLESSESMTPTGKVERVTVAGAGSWGTTVANLLAGKGLDVTLWAREPELVECIQRTGRNDRYLQGVALHPRLTAVSDLVTSLLDADVAVFAIPAQSLRDVLRQVHRAVREDVVIVNLAKGIEAGTGARCSEMVFQELKQANPVGVLSGPNIAWEVVRGIPSKAVVACSNYRYLSLLRDAVLHSVLQGVRESGPRGHGARRGAEERHRDHGGDWRRAGIRRQHEVRRHRSRVSPRWCASAS